MKSNLVKFFFWGSLFLTVFQGMIPMMPITDVTLISAVTMYLVTVMTVWKQSLSKNIQDAAMLPTIAVAIVATLGGVNELLNVFTIPEITGQWIRFGITFTTLALNTVSKVLYPTEEKE